MDAAVAFVVLVTFTKPLIPDRIGLNGTKAPLPVTYLQLPGIIPVLQGGAKHTLLGLG